MRFIPSRSPLASLASVAGLALALSACADPLAPTAGASLESAPSLDVSAAATVQYASGTATVYVCSEAAAFTTSLVGCEPAFNVTQNSRWNIIPGTSWISNEPDGNVDYSTPQQYYWYKLVFNLATDDAELDIDIFADNAATLYLNGGQFGAHANQTDYYPNYGCLGSDPVTCSGFTGPASFGTSSGFVSGDNVLTIRALNATFVQGCEEANADPATCDSATGLNFVATVNLRGDEGCTPGYWKQEQHHDSWVTFSPDQTVGSVFTGAGAYASITLDAALDLGGGAGVEGARRNLLRAAVAALLNSTGVYYTMTTAEVIAAVNAALATNDRATMLALASELDADNNGGCPLN